MQTAGSSPKKVLKLRSLSGLLEPTRVRATGTYWGGLALQTTGPFLSKGRLGRFGSISIQVLDVLQPLFRAGASLSSNLGKENQHPLQTT